MILTSVHHFINSCPRKAIFLIFSSRAELFSFDSQILPVTAGNISREVDSMQN